MPAYSPSFHAAQPQRGRGPHHHSAFSQGRNYSFGRLSLELVIFSQQVQNSIAKTLIYTLAISGARLANRAPSRAPL